MKNAWRNSAILVAAGAAMYLPLSRGFVERHYSTRVYPTLQRVLTSSSNHAPFALIDVASAILLTCWIVLAARDVGRSTPRWRAVVPIAVRTIVWCAAIYLVFVAVWGLNYRRQRFIDKLPYDAAQVTAEAA